MDLDSVLQVAKPWFRKRPETICEEQGSIESGLNGARLRREGHYFQYQCPSCGLAGPRARTAEEAEQSWRAATHQWHTAFGQASAVKKQGLLTGGPLDERELRIIRILYNGKGCAACLRSSRGPMP